MTKGLITVFGGAGFVGKYVVRALVRDGWRVRVPVRRPHTALDLKVMGNVGQVQLVQANVRFANSVERAVEGSDAVINLVAVLYEQGKQSFEAVHAQGAKTIAEASARAGITNFVQISAIGADPDSKSHYARSKAMGETYVREAIPSATIIRPSIIFGAEDGFFNRFAAMTQLSPILPLFGGGTTKFQPVYVGDVAQAIAQVVSQGSAEHGKMGTSYELGGPRAYSYKELMAFILSTIDRKRILLPLPWVAANALGFIGDMVGALPIIKPFLTRDQLRLMKTDNIVSDEAQGFSELGISPQTIEAVVPSYLARYRKHGQYHEKSA